MSSRVDETRRASSRTGRSFYVGCRLFHLFLLLRIATPFATAHEVIPNEVVGEPYINCAADAIYVKFKTNSTFEGHVNLRYAPNKYCYQVLVTNNQVEVLIPHGECDIARRRNLHPPGLILSSSLSVSFHPEFTTADDRLFHFDCFHTKSSAENQLEPGSSTMPLPDNAPQCSYGVLRSSGGSPVGMVSLGDVVYHQWKCENTGDRCVAVKNCVLIAGDTKHALVDSNGCSKDVKILPHLSYIDSNEVGVNVTVFGASESSLVYFECQIGLFAAENGKCPVPNCDGAMRNRRETSNSVGDEELLEVQSQRIEISQLGHLQSLLAAPTFKTDHCASEMREEDTCIPYPTMIVVAIAATTLVLLVITVILLMLLQRYRYYHISTSSA